MPAFRPVVRPLVGRALLLFSLATLAACETPDEDVPYDAVEAEAIPHAVILPLRDIAGRTPEEVAAVLGPPTQVTTTQSNDRQLPKHFFRGDSVEVVFVNGKADWITVFPPASLRFQREALEAFGLEPAEPTFENPNGVIRWEERIPGIRWMAFFPERSRGGVHYAYINVVTSP